MHTREATAADNEELQRLQAQCPMGTGLIVSVVNTPDFFARAKAYESCKVYVACDDGRIIGSAACAIRDALVGGQVRRIGYEFGAFIAPDCRRRGIASQLHRQREDYLIQAGAALSYVLILEKNVPAMRYVERHGFTRHRALAMATLWPYKEVDLGSEKTIRAARSDDLAAVADVLNETWRGRDFYTPTSANALGRFVSRTPAYGLDSLVVLQDRSGILACLGIWDWTQVARTTVKALSLRLRVLGLTADIIRCVRLMPRPPKAGACVRQWCLTPIGFRDIEHLAVLLRYANNEAMRGHVDQMLFICERKHPMLSTTKGLFPIDVGLHLYVKLLGDVAIGKDPVFADAIDL